jgi:exodeoxyribonuclease-3
MTNLKIATFNVNSVRTRIPILLDWIGKHLPDVLCMQETKVIDESFPKEEFESIGYNVAFHGQKAYSGVAIASREKPSKVGKGMGDIDEPDQARLIWTKFSNLIVINTYVPQGREVGTEYWEYKLEWFRRLRKFFENNFKPSQKILWCGDINAAPTDIDLHNPKGNKGHVCFNDELSEMLKYVADWGFTDLFRHFHPDEGGHYSWFDYRTRGSVERNIGWRVDLIFTTKSLTKKAVKSYIDLEPRKADQPSDHAPVVAEFEF